MQRTFQHRIVTKRLEIDQGNLRIKFSALNVNFSGSSPDSLGSRRPAKAGVKDNYPPSPTPPPRKSGYFTAIGSCSLETVADMQHQAIVTSFSLVSTSMILNDLETPK